MILKFHLLSLPFEIGHEKFDLLIEYLQKTLVRIGGIINS